VLPPIEITYIRATEMHELKFSLLLCILDKLQYNYSMLQWQLFV